MADFLFALEVVGGLNFAVGRFLIAAS